MTPLNVLVIKSWSHAKLDFFFVLFCFNATKTEKHKCGELHLTYLATGALPSADTRALVDVDAPSPVLTGRSAQG